MDTIHAGISIGLSTHGFYPALFSLMGIRSGLISLAKRNHTVLSIYYSLRNVSREILSLKEHIDNGILSKTEEYDDIMRRYNNAVMLYKEKANEVLTIAESNKRAGDLRHCPSCSVDIGKEVTRSRNCPACKNRILLYRVSADKCVLLSREDELLVSAAEKACNDIVYPDLLSAYTLEGDMLREYRNLVAIEEQRENIESKASNLII